MAYIVQNLTRAGDGDWEEGITPISQTVAFSKGISLPKGPSHTEYPFGRLTHTDF